MNPEDFTRLVNNFYISKGLESRIDRISLDAELVNYFNTHQEEVKKKYKVAFVFICLNPLYWQYAPDMVKGAKDFFLPGHKTDFFFWTDIPQDGYEVHKKLFASFQQILAQKGATQLSLDTINKITEDVVALRKREDVHIIPTEAVEWPYPTLLRYNLFLQEEARLKDYDYVFYLDIDMQFCQVVGDEILPKTGIMAAQHPMYAIKKELWPPYEPNEKSASYIKRPGRIVENNGQKRFQPLYFAGGFQGGRADKFIDAMKQTRLLIERDLTNQYVPIWNDETAWNKYLSENPPEIVLDPSYIYPDSLIKEYYLPLWGRDYPAKIKTLTKWFTTSKEGGEAVNKMIQK